MEVNKLYSAIIRFSNWPLLNYNKSYVDITLYNLPPKSLRLIIGKMCGISLFEDRQTVVPVVSLQYQERERLIYDKTFFFMEIK